MSDVKIENLNQSPNGLIQHAEPQRIVLLDTDVPGVKHAIGTTAANGLQHQVIDDESRLPFPRRPKGGRQVSEVLSFLDELNRRPLLEGKSTLWGDCVSGTVAAVYNDHANDLAGWRDDTLSLQLVEDPDWKLWHAISGKYYPQFEFGDVVENLLHTFVDPDQADILEIIDSIRASSSGNFESSIDRSAGGQKLTYTEEVKATASGRTTANIEVPKTVTLKLRPWEGHVNTYEVDAWFRLRVQGGNLALAIKLKPTQQLLRTAWAENVQQIVEATNIPVLAYRGQR